MDSKTANGKQTQQQGQRIKSRRTRNNRKSYNDDLLLLTERDCNPLRKLVLDFLESSEPVLELPNLTNTHRKFLHRFAAAKGLKTRSYGPRENRIFHLMQRKCTPTLSNVQPLGLTEANMRVLDNYIEAIHRHLGRPALYIPPQQYNNRRSEGMLLGQRHVPPLCLRLNPCLLAERMALPIYQQREHLLKLVQQHSVIIISGETGSGKTTQVPQYILEDAALNKRPCRIVVTQPRRIAAITLANRVAIERNEPTGSTVGYQIRMDSSVRKSTNLIYTTSGCFLRAIMSNCDTFFRQVSHLIIDEIHERDKDTDFALITVKEQLHMNRDIKVILMSATMDIVTLSQYFGNCPVVQVPGQSFDVKIFQLEDILYHTSYRTDLMEKYLNSIRATYDLERQKIQEQQMEQCVAGVRLEDAAQQEAIDSTIDCCCDEQRDISSVIDLFEQLQYYIESEHMPVNVAHSRTGITPLMVACLRNIPVYVLYFLDRNASVHIRDASGRNAFHYASMNGNEECLRLLQTENRDAKYQCVQKEQVKIEKSMLLDAYQMQFNSESEVDHLLILSLIEGLYRSKQTGGIMVFLPGYTDILQQRELIQSTLPSGTYRICILHGQMDTEDQNEALQICSERKIILSTNIGQTSITIPDLVYIIDSGKVKMKTYDTVRESSQLQSVWISQADACQRAGRAGRTQNGVCYRLYSLEKYNDMSRFCTPEFMRVPLTEICLYAKTLNRHIKVADFLARALNPPSTISVSKAVQKLEILQIFTKDENVTQLGKCLVELPLDVQLGKTLLFSIFLRCYPSVLTIVAFHSVKDPFILPTDRTAQGKASFQRKQFAGRSNSDQWGIVLLYTAYMDVRHNRKRLRDFCNKNYVSQAGMELFCATRRQINDVVSRHFVINGMTSEYSNDLRIVRLALAAGFYPNIAFINREKYEIVSGDERNLVLQRNSALNPPNMKNLKDFANKLDHDWIVFYEKSRLGGNTHSTNMNTLIPALAVALMCGRECHFECVEDSDDDSDDADLEAENEVDSVNGVNGIEEQLNTLNICHTNINNSTHHPSVAASQNGGITPSKDNILNLDRWIRFQCNSLQAERLDMLRQLIDKQFQMFLRQTHLNKSNNLCAEILHKLMITQGGQPPPPFLTKTPLQQQHEHQHPHQQQLPKINQKWF